MSSIEPVALKNQSSEKANFRRHGRPPLTAEQLFDSANFTLAILPARLAHRIQSLRNLPYIVVSNPHVSKIHGNYLHSLSTLLPWAEKRVESLDDEIKFTEVMADLVQTHSNTISILARGFLEARRYISPQEVTRFLDEHLRARIGTRLIAEQHIALHMSSQPHNELCPPEDKKDLQKPSSFIGVIDTELRPADIVRHCEAMVAEICELKYGVRPRIVITGEPDYAFAHIPMHLEYIITELLKNAFRATVERGMEREPIEVTIAPLPETPTAPQQPTTPIPPAPKQANPSPHHSDNGSDSAAITNEDQGNANLASKTSAMLAKESHSPARAATTTANIRPLECGTPGVTLRIRDRGGGIAPANYARIWDYSFTTFNDDDARASLHGGGGGGHGWDALSAISGPGGDAGSPAGTSLAGLGYGLPLGRAYAEYFGGGIAVQSLWGWGTDCYLSLRGVGKMG